MRCKITDQIQEAMRQLPVGVSFNKIAANILKDIHFSAEELDKLCGISRKAKFSERETIIWQNETHILVLLLWCENTTNIHDHGFSGAFKALASPRFHYVFENTGSLITLVDSEILEHGSVREIPQGAGLIHQIWHIEETSLSLLLREKKCQKQKDYYPPFFSLDVDEIKDFAISSKSNPVDNWVTLTSAQKIHLLFNELIFDPKSLNQILQSSVIDAENKNRIKSSIEIQKRFLSLASRRSDVSARVQSGEQLRKLFELMNKAVT